MGSSLALSFNMLPCTLGIILFIVRMKTDTSTPFLTLPGARRKSEGRPAVSSALCSVGNQQSHNRCVPRQTTSGRPCPAGHVQTSVSPGGSLGHSRIRTPNRDFPEQRPAGAAAWWPQWELLQREMGRGVQRLPVASAGGEPAQGGAAP